MIQNRTQILLLVLFSLALKGVDVNATETNAEVLRRVWDAGSSKFCDRRTHKTGMSPCDQSNPVLL